MLNDFLVPIVAIGVPIILLVGICVMAVRTIKYGWEMGDDE